MNEPPRESTGRQSVWPYLGCGCLTIVAPFVVWPILFGRDHFPVPGQTACISNVKQIGLALLQYTQDHDERLPLRAAWQHAVYPYTKNRALLHCPEEPDQTQPSYAFNARLDLRKAPDIAAPATVVMVFDSIPGNELNGGTELLPDPPRHDGKHTVGFLDGHVKSVPAAAIASLVWRPAAISGAEPKTKQ